MATSYSDIFNAFLYKIEGYKLIQLVTEDRERIISIYLTAACRKAYKKCKQYVDLNDRDDKMQEFHCDLEDDMIDILAECMVTEWLRPKLYSEELIESRLNTKDYKQYSPLTQKCVLNNPLNCWETLKLIYQNGTMKYA